MACNLRTSQSGNNIGVYNKQGQPSKLFDQIVSNPHLNFQQALDAYSTVYELEEEPALIYKDNSNNIHTTFSAALKATPQGNVLGGVEVDGKFTELFRVDSNTNTNSFNGLLNNLVKSELLTGESFIDTDGKKIYRAAGEVELKRMITSDLAITTARGSVGYAAKQISSIGIYFDENLIGKRAIENKTGEIEYLTQEQLDAKSYEQLKRTTSDPVGIMAERAYKEFNRPYGDSTPIDEMTITPENLLQEKLIKLLSDLGVKTVSFENYFRRNKIQPSAQALADISNKIVAFKDGEISESDLTEEVAHFIVEATDPAQVENLIRNIHKTAEWNEFQQSYREIYSKEYSGIALEEVVRKEVLGKVLANSLQDNFAQNKASQTENTIIARLRDVFNQFFENVRALFRPIYQQQLEEYTQGVYNNLMSDSLYENLSQEQLDGKEYVYYSIEQAGITPQYRELQRTIEQLSNQQYALAKKYSAPASQNMLREAKDELLKAIETTEQEIEYNSKLKAMLNVATVANAQLNYLSRVIDSNATNGRHFAQEEESVYQNFVTKLEPMLSQLNNQLRANSKAEKQIKDKFEVALKKSIELKGKVPVNNEVALNNIVNRIIAKNNLTGQEEEKFREQLSNVLTAAQKDSSWFHSHMGQLLHSQNILLNLAGDVIAKTVTDERRYFLPRIKNFLNQLEATGFNPTQLKQLIDKDGYIHNEVDNSKLEQEELKEKIRAYNTATGESITEFNESLVDSLSIGDRNNYNNLLNEFKRERLESFFTQEHLDKLNNTFIEINGIKIFRKELPEVALQYEKYYRGQLTQIRTNNNGINTENDRYEIEELNKQRVKDSNPRNPDGSLKNGLKEVYNEELDQTIVEYDNSTITSEDDVLEAQKVYGLQMINLLNKKFYEGSVRQESVPQPFLEKINQLETEQEKWDFVQLNAYVGFKPDYWENFGQNESLAERLTSSKDGKNNEEIDELLEDIRTQQSIISNILKANRVFNQPAETNVSQMSDIETSSIKDATIQLESLYQKANSFLEESDQVVEPFSEQRLNEAFRKDLIDEGITDDDGILNHILKNVTPKNKSSIEKAIKVADKIKKGEDVVLDKSMQRVFSEGMAAEEAQSALMRFAESRVLPYYKRTEPIGYSQERQALQEGINNNTVGTVENFLRNSEFTQINPSYSFYNQNENINPKWLANRDAKRPQYTEEFLRRVRNDDYYNRYGIDESGNATRNLQEWNARQAVLELQDWSIENYNLTGKHNRYLLPQQRRSGVKRVENFIKTLNVSNIREGINDLVNYREDDAELGQDETGAQAYQSVKISSIPVYGVRPVGKEDVTDELLTSYSWMAQQSALYRARKENISDMLTIQDAITNMDIVGKSTSASNTYKMFKSFLNSNYYGINETFSYKINIFSKSVDLGKIARVFNSWVRTVALTSFTVPFTSLWQSKIQRFSESKIGELINPIAFKLSQKEFNKNAGAAAAEIMNMNSKAKLNILGEAYGMYDLNTTRFENSSYNKATRFALGAGSGMHSLGNFPTLPGVMLSVLMDYRYYNGNIVSYNQYLRMNRGAEKKQLTQDWQKLDLFYNDITTENGVQSYKKENISKKTGLTGEALETKIDQLHEALTNRVSTSIQRIDSQIPQSQKSLASRDARANFFLNFMNWWLLQVQYKFKSYSYDTSADTFTEGSFITTAKFLRDIAVKRRNVKQVWRETMADDTKRNNLKRTLVEFGVANALAIAAIALSNYADDDDDPTYLLSFLDYFATRVATEQISGTIALPRQIGQTIESPLAAADRFYDLFNIFDLTSDKIIEKGSFAGKTERERWAAQNLVVLKDIYRLSNVKQSQDQYQYFNEDVYDYAFLSLFFSEDPEEAED